VLETSAAVFHGRGKEVVSRQREDQFFDVHVEADEGHHKLGDHLLALQSAAAFDRLERVIAEGWKVLDAMLDRMTELVLAA
jgi:pyrroloquinoline quinone (PQQ) biosynthesis protein C